MSEYSQIACEICRTKKRKCDRKIPTCSQCVHASQTCTYPGTSKRGLPSGYIASIEERLAQTEAALLQALSIIYASQIDGSEPFPATTERPRDMEYNEVRIAKVKEWQGYPLDTEEHQRNWMQYKLATDPAQIVLTTSKHQADHASQSSDKRQSQGHQTRKRQKTAQEWRGIRDTSEDCRPGSDPDAVPLTRPRASQGNGDLTKNMHQGELPHHDDETSISTPWRQGTTTRSSESYCASDASRVPMTGDVYTVEILPPSDQIKSKAKRLSTLHSRKYF